MIMTTDSPNSATDENTHVTNVAPELLESWLVDGDTVLIDVREDFEYAEERIDSAIHWPMSKFDAEAIRRECGGKRVVFHCRSGKRAQEAAQRYGANDEPMFQLAGGIEGWTASGRATIQPAAGSRLPVMRQVQITAGALVTLGVVLGVTLSPWFLGIAAFVGCGLMFAGISGWCGMAKLLAVMPWNKT